MSIGANTHTIGAASGIRTGVDKIQTNLAGFGPTQQLLMSGAAWFADKDIGGQLWTSRVNASNEIIRGLTTGAESSDPTIVVGAPNLWDGDGTDDFMHDNGDFDEYVPDVTAASGDYSLVVQGKWHGAAGDRIFHHNGATNFDYFNLHRLSATTLRFQTRTLDGGLQSTNMSTSMVDGSLFTAAVTISSGSVKTYVALGAGSLTAGGTNTLNAGWVADPGWKDCILFGINVAGLGILWPGSLANVAIFHTELTSTNIQDIHTMWYTGDYT